jgi:putative transposase
LIYLFYKAEWNNKEVVHIDRFFPSSKTCQHCGYINHNLTLKDRTWKCPECGEVLDRDVNAAINIFNEGCRKNMSGGTSDYKRRAKIRPSLDGKGVETFKDKELI